MSDERAVHCQHCNNDYLSESAKRCPGIAPVETEQRRRAIDGAHVQNCECGNGIGYIDQRCDELRAALSAAPQSEPPTCAVCHELLPDTCAGCL